MNTLRPPNRRRLPLGVCAFMAVVAGVCAGANVSAPGGDPSVREDLDTLTETVSAQGASLLSAIERVDDSLLSLAFHFTEHAAAGALELVDGYMSTFGDSADDVSSVEGGVWSSGGWSASARRAFAHAKRFWVQLPYASVPQYGASDTFSVSVWIRPTATDIAQVNSQFSVVRHQGSYAGFRLGIIGGKPYFNVDGRIYGGDWYATASSGTPVASNTWTLLVGTWVCKEDFENPGTYENVTALYVNGALVSSVTNVDAGRFWGYPVQEPSGAEPYLTVGGSAYVYNETVYDSAEVIFDGRTAQAAIWDWLLDDAAVAAIYNEGAGVDLPVEWPPWDSLAVLVDGNGATTAEVGRNPTETVVLNGSAKPATALYGGFVSGAMMLTSDAYSLLSAPERLRVGAWLLGDGADLGDVAFRVSADGGSHYADVAMTRTSSLLDGSYFASGVTTNFVAGTSLIMQLQSGGNDVTLRGWSRQAD